MRNDETNGERGVTMVVAGGMGKSAVIEFLRSIYQAAGYSVAVAAREPLGDDPARIALDSLVASWLGPRVGGPPLQGREGSDILLIEWGSGLLWPGPPKSVDVWVALPDGRDGDELPPACITSWHAALKPEGIWIGGPGPEHRAPPAPAVGGPLLWPRDYQYHADGPQWRWSGPGRRLGGLAFPAMRGVPQLANAAAALAVWHALAPVLPVAAQAVRIGLAQAALPGRFQILPGQPAVVLDIAHTEPAARAAALSLDRMGYHPRTVALIDERTEVCGAIRQALAAVVDEWHPIPAEQAALRLAQWLERADPADRLLVCGSYAIVAAVLNAGLPRLSAAHLA